MVARPPSSRQVICSDTWCTFRPSIVRPTGYMQYTVVRESLCYVTACLGLCGTNDSTSVTSRNTQEFWQRSVHLRLALGSRSVSVWFMLGQCLRLARGSLSAIYSVGITFSLHWFAFFSSPVSVRFAVSGRVRSAFSLQSGLRLENSRLTFVKSRSTHA